MRAVVCHRYGGPEVARIEHVAEPSLGDGEVLVRVVASSVNRTDCGVRKAKPWFARLFYGLRGPRQPILGSEFAGVVEQVGTGASRFAVGDRVFGFGDEGMGGHAELLARHEEGMIAPIPDELSFEQAAVATEGAHYAGTTLRATGVGPGSDVLVYGASGGIGSAAVQLALHLGARVVAVCGTDAVERVAALGPDRVVDYQREDFAAIGERFDLVFDAVGKTSFRTCRPLLRDDGDFAVTDFGPRYQNPFLVLPTRFLPGPRVRFPLPRNGPESMAFVVDALGGRYRPLVDRTYELDDIVEAYRYVETERKVGNVVLRVAPAPDDGADGAAGELGGG